MSSWRTASFATALLVAAACAQPTITPAEDQDLLTGADQLVRSDFRAVDGMRVGLIANHTSRSGDRHLADLIAEAPNVDLVALFGPEHGIRGDNDDGAAISDGVDPTTGVPVYSLYGSRREPDDAMLDDIDVLIFDIQDIGARFYTFIATMGRSMEVAARTGTQFLVLDRPNPLGGETVDGFVLEPGFESFVGPFPIPVQHGMTVAELAMMAKDEGWIEGADALDLSVIGVSGWTRAMTWAAYGNEWIPTSPNIPNFDSALVYPGMCFFEATTANEGRGTPQPFLRVGHAELDAGAALAALGRVPGIRVDTLTYMPVSIPGKSTNPRFRDTRVPGLMVEVVDHAAVRPLEVGIRILHAVFSHVDAPQNFLRSASMSRLGGTERLYDLFISGATPEEILEAWEPEVEAFRRAREPYLLYR
jgi:uncharacterized protein YbbC (DUF1343 family)